MEVSNNISLSKGDLDCCRSCFWCSVEIAGSDDCWLWRGRTSEKGYGLFSKHRAHRVAWVLAYSSIPNDMCVCHRCDVRPCVNPSHLFLGTQVENIHDMYQKKRQGARHSGESNSACVLTLKDVAIIRESSASLAEMSQRFGVTKANISCIRTGKTWRHANA
jgi:hypothetical protein